MDSFDSRALKFGDSVTQQFTEQGQLTYVVELGESAFGGELNAFVVDVEGGDMPPVQHFVKVFISDGALQVEPPRLKVTVNDTVLWSALDRSVPPFRVRSTDHSELAFDSAALHSHAILSHAFGASGSYCWTGGRGLAGEIIVTDPQLHAAGDLAAYRRQLASLRQSASRADGSPLAIFRIDNDTSEPASVSIVTGQTVLWLVQNTRGIAISFPE